MTAGGTGSPHPAGDPLAALCVLTRLEIGPVRVEPKRAVCPYRVVGGEEVSETDLIYSFEEPVFDPGDAAAVNVAAMMTAQVALNYGLFCEEMVFRGPFDETDRRFLQKYAAHTAREIYVKKFLEPNEFLTESVRGLPALRRSSYLRSRLVFDEGLPMSFGRPAGAADLEAGRPAVLSSGGKDSLLSFGLLRELGTDPQAVFINESGKHWFTALNAYRGFVRDVPATARVWTNSDRVFSWMLRRLPFVRQDFARVRADEYPIRLWTVAVFLFGAVPILLRRGLGRLVIGDEFDTTVRRSHRGVTHYDGLFDQGRFFDNVMSRYFRAKQWDVVQLSLLRSMSEMLIEKTLGERYPDLLRLQTSCHAAHMDGAVVRPCGRCEKCRRIVGMLEAMGMDPRDCGYTDDQIRQCLAAIAERGVHQESAGAEHLAFLLSEKGLIPRTEGIRPRPEIMMLRFDPEASPLETVPADLRSGLHAILLEHAEGALARRSGSWIPCDPLSDTEPGPSRAGEDRNMTRQSRSRESYLLGELTWPEARARLKDVDIALLPVGSVEQHGPHLPLDTDAYDADRLARDVAEACSRPRPIVLPLIPYGVSYHHEDFPGTVSITPETLSRMVHEIGMSLAGHGLKKLVIINGHGGNGPALHYAAQMINRDARIFTCVDTGETSDADIDAMAETPNDVHAGEIETSTTLYLRPELVKMEDAKPAVPRFSSRYLDFTSKRSVGWYARTKKISESGVLGDPTRASREKGEKMWKTMVEHLVGLVEHVKDMTLEEIHQKRY